MQSLQHVYTKQLQSMFPEIIQLKNALISSRIDSDGVLRLSGMVHTLSGLGTTVGFPAISQTGKKLNAILLALDKESKQPELTQYLEDFEEACRQAIMNEPQSDKDENMEISGVVNEQSKVVVILAKEGRPLHDIDKQLKHFGYVIAYTVNAQEFKASMASANPHVVIAYSDLSLDEIAVLTEVMQAERRRSLSPQLIVISPHDNFDARLAAVRLGAQGFFSENADVIRIVDKIEQLVARFSVAPIYHVLIVDDDEIQVRFYTHVLQAAGMTVTVIAEPRDVLEVIANQAVDLVLMDFIMPHCNGEELATIIRQHEKYVSLPIVFLSARDDLEQLLIKTRLGIDDFLVKPVTSDQLVSAVRSRAERSAELRALMARDGFTGLLNHAHFIDMLVMELGQAKRFKTSVAYASIDIDHFKKINDTYGHAAGDTVIRSLARMLQQRLRRSDIIGRCGGEEFGIIMPDCTIENAAAIIDSMRQQFGTMSFRSDHHEIKVTFSGGVTLLNHFDNFDEVIKVADNALYEAKNQGRNCIVVRAK